MNLNINIFLKDLDSFVKNHLYISNKCPTCGANLQNGECIYCGYESTLKSKNKAKQDSDKNPFIAFVLCFFLGYFGIHHFYCKRPYMGMIYFLSGGCFGIGWIWNVLGLFFGFYQDGEKKYLGILQKIFKFN